MLGSSSCLMSSMGFRSEKRLARRDAAPVAPADSKAGSGCGQHLGGAAPGNPQAGAGRLLDTVCTVDGQGELRGQRRRAGQRGYVLGVCHRTGRHVHLVI